MRLLVGFDGSDGGRDALELARSLAEPAGASLLVVAVVPYGPLPVDFRALESDAAAEAEPLFEEARERLAGLDVETRGFGGGSPAGVLTDLAEAEEIDLIVVGSPHRGAVGRALIGSVAESLLHGAPCPVAVAPRGYAKERHEPARRIAVAYDGTPEAKAALHRAEAIAVPSAATIEVLTSSRRQWPRLGLDPARPPRSLPGPRGAAPVSAAGDITEQLERAAAEVREMVEAEPLADKGRAAGGQAVSRDRRRLRRPRDGGRRSGGAGGGCCSTRRANR